MAIFLSSLSQSWLIHIYQNACLAHTYIAFRPPREQCQMNFQTKKNNSKSGFKDFI